MVQGDTTSAMTAALAAFYERIAVAHVEAGLRTSDKYSPFPEEINRRIVGSIADLHFPPTVGARDNLLREGIAAESIHVTGEHRDRCVAVDHCAAGRSRRVPARGRRYSIRYQCVARQATRARHGASPRELDRGIEGICQALLSVAALPGAEIVLPVHFNPNIRKIVLPGSVASRTFISSSPWTICPLQAC